MNKSLADLISQVNDLAEEQGLLFTYDFQAAPKPKSPVPDSWEWLGEVSGFYIDSDCEIYEASVLSKESNKNVLPTEELAEAALAIAQLSQLMYRTWDNNGGWRPQEGKKRHTIEQMIDEIDFDCWSFSRQFLQFRTKEIAEDFLTKHRALIEQAAPILYGRVTE
ncbi:MAG TPA: hypothetical protein VIC51_12755 [Psychromonas sp.]